MMLTRHPARRWVATEQKETDMTTISELRSRVDRLNSIAATGHSGEAYWLSGADGRYCLMLGDCNALNTGHVPLARLADLVDAYVRGWIDAERAA
jgi:hypothetical protein